MGVLLGLLIELDQWIKLLYQLGHWHHSLSQGKQLNPKADSTVTDAGGSTRSIASMGSTDYSRQIAHRIVGALRDSFTSTLLLLV
jgi:hypothetical protein